MFRVKGGLVFRTYGEDPDMHRGVAVRKMLTGIHGRQACKHSAQEVFCISRFPAPTFLGPLCETNTKFPRNRVFFMATSLNQHQNASRTNNKAIPTKLWKFLVEISRLSN